MEATEKCWDCVDYLVELPYHFSVVPLGCVCAEKKTKTTVTTLENGKLVTRDYEPSKEVEAMLADTRMGRSKAKFRKEMEKWVERKKAGKTPKNYYEWFKEYIEVAEANDDEHYDPKDDSTLKDAREIVKKVEEQGIKL